MPNIQTAVMRFSFDREIWWLISILGSRSEAYRLRTSELQGAFRCPIADLADAPEVLLGQAAFSNAIHAHMQDPQEAPDKGTSELAFRKFGKTRGFGPAVADGTRKRRAVPGGKLGRHRGFAL